jgi:DNA primase
LLYLATYISDEKLSEIRQAADIVEIVSETVVLKKAGKNLIGLCPFHAEKTPSFTVSPDRQMFYCFGCGTGGNVFSFVMKRDGEAFAEAARTLARRCGVEIPEKPLSPAARRQADERSAVLDINRQALVYFQGALARSAEGQNAQDYLRRRGIRPATIENFALGYAPKGWDNLLNYLLKKGAPGALLEKAGLVVARKDGTGYYDRFRERIIFPIFDEGSRLVGFGGRVMDETSPKYLNSPETSLYSKRRTLYGLNRAKERCRSLGSVFIVEGYLDLIALHQAGHENSVATLGTALTAEHLKLLTRHAERMVLVYDSDAAGIRSAHRCIEVFWQEHVDFSRGDVFREDQADTRILVLPDGHDPDSFINREGAEAFQERADRAPGIITFLMESAIDRHGLSTEGKIRIVAELVGPLAAINDSVAQALYVQQLSERLGLPEDRIRERLSRLPSGARPAAPASQRPEAEPGVPAQAPGPHERFEQRIISMMLQFPEAIPEVNSRNILDYFENERLKSIGQSIIDFGLKSCGQMAELLWHVKDEKAKALLASLAVGEESWNMAGCRSLLDRFLYARQIERDARDIQKRIEDAEKANNEKELTRLLMEKQRMAVRRQRNRAPALNRK